MTTLPHALKASPRFIKALKQMLAENIPDIIGNEPLLVTITVEIKNGAGRHPQIRRCAKKEKP